MILKRIQFGLRWRTEKLYQIFEGYWLFPWRQVYQNTKDKAKSPQLLPVGRRSRAVGGPHTKILELIAAMPNVTVPNIIFVASGSPPPLIALRWAKYCGVKILLNQNGVYYPAVTKKYKDLNHKLLKVHQLADFVIYQSEYCKKTFEQWVGPASQKSKILWNGVDTKRFYPKLNRPWPKDTLRVLMTSSLNTETEYQYDYFAKFLQQLSTQKNLPFRKYEFRFAGRLTESLSKTFHDWERQYRDTNVNFIVLPEYSRDEAPLIYQQADVYLHLKYKDPCPNAVAEALACGLPVIHGDSGGTTELARQAGIKLKIDESWTENLALAESELLKGFLSIRDLEYVEELSKKARKLAEDKMSLIHWVEEHLNSFQGQNL